MDAVVAHLMNQHEWVIPNKLSDDQLKPFPTPQVSCVRNMLILLADEGHAIKVVARELPDALRIRPPSWMDLSRASFGGAAIQPSSQASVLPNSPIAHFMPSPSYLKHLLSQTGEGDRSLMWLFEESGRVSKELQRNDVRVVVKTNIPSLSTEAIEGLTDRLTAAYRLRPTVKREEVHRAVSFVLHTYKGSFPLAREQEQVFLRKAQGIIDGRPGSEVRAEFRGLRAPSWRLG